MTLEQQAREIIATKAEAAGELTFAREVRAGAWDHTNRRDIANVLAKLRAEPVERVQ
ncbi:hypothetical protein UFOVP1545_47 [uncultured Caudovirales phage]|uniref:Uncharacterized protein n=1 Tax=uncultured Caudovirales phage TaxID=2100421 RepID=A0A6J7XLV3_9CAUD|nr:hypothetical protein UFOVP1545_47 [uncultured Caudovirales phage]